MTRDRRRRSASHRQPDAGPHGHLLRLPPARLGARAHRRPLAAGRSPRRCGCRRPDPGARPAAAGDGPPPVGARAPPHLVAAALGVVAAGAAGHTPGSIASSTARPPPAGSGGRGWRWRPCSSPHARLDLRPGGARLGGQAVNRLLVVGEAALALVQADAQPGGAPVRERARACARPPRPRPGSAPTGSRSGPMALVHAAQVGLLVAVRPSAT